MKITRILLMKLWRNQILNAQKLIDKNVKKREEISKKLFYGIIVIQLISTIIVSFNWLGNTFDVLGVIVEIVVPIFIFSCEDTFYKDKLEQYHNIVQEPFDKNKDKKKITFLEWSTLFLSFFAICKQFDLLKGLWVIIVPVCLSLLIEGILQYIKGRLYKNDREIIESIDNEIHKQKILTEEMETIWSGDIKAFGDVYENQEDIYSKKIDINHPWYKVDIRKSKKKDKAPLVIVIVGKQTIGWEALSEDRRDNFYKNLLRKIDGKLNIKLDINSIKNVPVAWEEGDLLWMYSTYGKHQL